MAGVNVAGLGLAGHCNGSGYILAWRTKVALLIIWLNDM